MVRPRYKPVTPDQRIRELRKEFKAFQQEKEEPGPERARKLAAFVRQTHAERHLNMAMHAAQLCLEEDPDDPQLLIEAYLPPELDDPEDRLRALIDLQDLARYVDRPDLRGFADERIDAEAEAWIRDGDDAARRHRLRTLASMFDRAFSDTIRDRIEFA